MGSFCRRHGTNDQRSLVPPRFVGAGAEERMDGVGEAVRERVDENSGLHVVEGHHSLVAVHVDPNTAWPDVDRKDGGGFRPEGVVGLITQAQEPVSVGGAYRDFPLSIDGPARHP